MKAQDLLRMMSFGCWKNKVLNICDLYLEYGKEMNVTSSTETQMAKQCFSNASRCALLPQYEYVEGYMILPEFPGFPVAHAWVYDLDNQVYLDPTVSDAENNEYFGLRIPKNTMFSLMMNERYIGSIIETLCRSQFTPEEQNQYKREIVAANTDQQQQGIFARTRSRQRL